MSQKTALNLTPMFDVFVFVFVFVTCYQMPTRVFIATSL